MDHPLWRRRASKLYTEKVGMEKTELSDSTSRIQFVKIPYRTNSSSDQEPESKNRSVVAFEMIQSFKPLVRDVVLDLISKHSHQINDQNDLGRRVLSYADWWERKGRTKMAYRSGEMVKKVLKKLGAEKSLTPEAKDQIKKFVPDSKMIMGRAHRGLFAGRHIQYGNRVSEDGGNKTRRCWKPNVQDKKLFSYALDRQIRLKVTTHALRCIDRVGGLDEYLLKTPYSKIDSEMGLYWKAKIEKLYEELGKLEVQFFSPDEETKPDNQSKGSKLEKRSSRKHDQRRRFVWSNKSQTTNEGHTSADKTSQEDEIHEGGSDSDINEPRVAHA
ncbi:OLC1v1028966C1 [Oldenlandia corymbosa var. corymbosa]|uniref:Large ribosomal subunit protein bL28m n=1 Tax=Oldenlandia corymbosa var. corymbosa TaxID=529605 RepID=A0AAV1CD03_OLDCO|nr:OLC1v1028966C1 [Oldenlandia corymbosa var. corymbosa]